METKTKDMRLFHKFVRNNRKKGNDVIMDLNVNGIQYEGDENVITGFGEHFRQLATHYFECRLNFCCPYF
jgi:hypothetical protein